MSEAIESVELGEDEKQQIAQRLIDQARTRPGQGVDPVGPDGLVTGRIRTVLEEEISEHLGCDKRDPVGRNGRNSRAGARTKTGMTEVGPVEVDVPAIRDGSFERHIMQHRERRLDGPDPLVLSLTTRPDHGGGPRTQATPPRRDQVSMSRRRRPFPGRAGRDHHCEPRGRTRPHR